MGRLAFDQTLRLYRQQKGERLGFNFKHGEKYSFGDDLPWLVASYHPSHQNTQTGRLTEEMFNMVWEEVRGLLAGDTF